MTCTICGRHKVYHASEWNTHAEHGCHDGVTMDDDVHAELNRRGDGDYCAV